jgi:hypothetical protein
MPRLGARNWLDVDFLALLAGGMTADEQQVWEL